MQAMRYISYLLLTTLSGVAASLPTSLEHIRTLDGIEEYELKSNGLSILLMPNEALPVATVMVTYKVGSRHEVTGTTGATHILEHMMFKGTPRFNTENNKDYFSAMERIGALSNATTWFDRTNYFATLPSQYVPMAIELEADRMRNLLIQEEDLKSEMTVVRNEYERGENSPVSTLIKELFATAFMAHGYSHPTIGWKSDIENTSPEKLRKFYDTYYWPENAALTVIGGFDREETLSAIIEHYGAIGKAPNPIPTVDTVEPEQIGPRRVVIERAGQVGVVMKGYKIPEATHKDWPALLLIDQIIGADKTGRLYRSLDDKGKANATFTFAPELHDPGLFVFGAYLTPDATHEEVEKIIDKEIDALIGGGVTEDELNRAKSVIRSNIIYGRDGPYSIAGQINDAIAMGDWTAYVNRPKEIDAVQAQTIQDVAKRYFKNSRSTTGWFVPEVTNTLATLDHRIGGPYYFRDPDVFGPEANQPRNTATPTQAATVDFSSRMKRETVSGIDLITVDMPIEGVVSYVGSFAAGEALSPEGRPMLASLTAAMLDKGSTSNDRFAIAELLDSLGADISFGADSHSLGFSGRFLRPDAGSVLELLAEQLRNPAFDPEVFETVRTRQKTNLLQAVDDPNYRASSQLSRMLYPTGHPNREEQLNTLLSDLEDTTVENLRDFHNQYYGTESMRLVFVGDIDFEQIKAAVANAFEGWDGGAPYDSDTAAQKENKAEEERIYISDKTSVSVLYGYNTGLQRSEEEYLHFMLGNYILGGSFNSRLMTEIRQVRGLTYSIRSSHQGDILTPGNWTANVSLSPSMLEAGLNATDAVLKNWYSEGVTEDEVNAAIETLSGSYLVGLSTTDRVARQIDSFLQRGLPIEYVDQYPVKIQQITSEQVNRAIKTYFDPDNLKLVVAGSLEGSGSSTTAPQTETISVRMDTPDAGWTVRIDKIYRSKDGLLVISKLSQNTDAAAQVITTVADSVEIPPEMKLPTRHYVLGKTWAWGDTGNYTFIDSVDALGEALEGAELVYPK